MTLREIARIAREAEAWRPATLAVLSDGLLHRKRNALLGIDDREHLEAAAGWLARAQDTQTDGGVSGRYRFGRGWSSSYPETTGYIVPTMLALEAEAALPGFRARAGRCIDFLLSVQLPSGAFPGMEIATNRDQPSIFNSAQILNGLTAWHRASGDANVLQAAHRVADWLVAEQDPDGAWRRHLYGSGRTYTYMAHAGCWLAEFGEYVDDARYLTAARAHLAWVLTHVDETTGWIEDCGFDEGTGAREAVTHTIAYTIWGVLMMSRILRDDRGFGVARRAAHAVARRLELSKWLPGMLDASWKAAANYACLTGNAQMALIWLELHRLEGDPALVSAACKAIDLVKRAQPVRSSDPNIRGAIAGSDPVWGQYIHLALPNWAAKFFIDALLAKARTLRTLAPLPCAARGVSAVVTTGVPQSLPTGARGTGRRPRVVLLTDDDSHKVPQFTEAWAPWGFRPDAVVIHEIAEAPRVARALEFARDYGVMGLVRRLAGMRAPTPAAASATTTVPASRVVRVSDYCAARGIPTTNVRSFEDPADLERVRALDADLFVFAGGGIMRQKTLELARLGMLNVHMGVLPQMRGMNVAEWSVLIGAPVGCTVHVVDAGIDTGGIVLFQPIDVAGAHDIAALRRRVDVAQVAALGRVVQWVLEHGTLPPAYAQQPGEGRQYFAMHDDLRDLLQAALRGGSTSSR